MPLNTKMTREGLGNKQADKAERGRKMKKFTKEQEDIMKSTLWALSTIKHCRIDNNELKSLQDTMNYNINIMDKLEISWKYQNSIFYIAESMDIRAFYLSTMLERAILRV